VVLKLDDSFAVQVPVSFHLPQLKIIHLIHINHICFPNDELLTRHLFDGSVLREHVVKHYNGIRLLYVESATVKTLKPGGNMEFSELFIDIRAPNLRCLEVHDSAKHYYICNVSFLVESNLYINVDKNVFHAVDDLSLVHVTW